MARSPRPAADPAASVKNYRHPQEAATRPDAGAAPRFRSKKPSATYRYDSTLSPALDWDMSPARDTASWLLAAIWDAAALPNQTFAEPRELIGADGAVLMRVAGLQDALAALKRMQAPFLDWTGKAERLSFDVPTLPLFVHDRLSTEAIVKTLEGHRKRADQDDLFRLFADPHLPMNAQINAYAHRSGWVNRMILGDSLSVMNSLARFEGLAGQVQCIYMNVVLRQRVSLRTKTLRGRRLRVTLSFLIAKSILRYGCQTTVPFQYFWFRCRRALSGSHNARPYGDRDGHKAEG